MPEGEWICFLKNCQVNNDHIEKLSNNNPGSISGGKFYYYVLENDNLNDYPVFLKVGELMTIRDYKSERLLVYGVPFPNGGRSQIFYHYPIPTNLAGYQNQSITKYQLRMVKSGGGYELEVKNIVGELVGKISMQQHKSKERIWVADISSISTTPGNAIFTDLDNDGSTTGRDLRLWQQMLSQTTRDAQDVNSDGKLNIYDLLFMLRAVYAPPS